MRKLTLLAVVVLVLAMVFALAACNRAGDSTEELTQPPAATQQPAVSETDPPPVSDNFNLTGLPIVNEPITLTVMQSIADATPVDVNNNWFVGWLEEKTNIHIDYIIVSAADWDTQVSLTLASRNYPDIFMGASHLDMEELGVSQGILIRTDELIEQYAPVLHERMMSDPGVLQAVRTSDGHIYCIPRLMAQGIDTAGHFFINHTWLDYVGMEVPRTVNQLTDALRAFRDMQPRGGGEIPWVADFSQSTGTSVHNALYFWGIPSNDIFVSLVEDQQVVFQPFMNGYREAYEWLHMLFSEGLLDPDVLTQDAGAIIAKLNDENAGFFTNWRLIAMGIDPIAEHAQFMLPVAADGFQPRIANTMEAAGRAAYITIANQHVRETIRWFDVQHEIDIMFSSNYGPEGTGWFRDTETGRVNVIPMDIAERSRYALTTNGVFYAPGDWYFEVYEQPIHRIEKFEYCLAQQQAGVNELYSYILLNVFSPLTAEERERVTLIFADLQIIIAEFTASFIMSGITDARWEEFINVTRAAGADEYVEIYQRAFDREFRPERLE